MAESILLGLTISRVNPSFAPLKRWMRAEGQVSKLFGRLEVLLIGLKKSRFFDSRQTDIRENSLLRFSPGS
jgi:hypothetical protein